MAAEQGEPILSASFKVLFDKLDSPIIKDSSPNWGIDADLEKLEETLLMIETVLVDAEQQINKKTQQRKKEALKKWLNELNHLVYDTEDILDEYAIYVEQYQVCFSIPSEIKHQIESGVKNINERLEKLKNIMTILGLKVVHVEGRMINEMVRRPRTSSLLDESCFYGRETDKAKIIARLLMVDGIDNEKNFEVLPIVGMGGLGKTTLAQSIFNDENVEKHFKLRAWVCVSEEVDTVKITKAILESATRDAVSLSDLDPLQCLLKDTLNKKRFLIVLDDVWNEDPHAWDILRVPFTNGEKGSRIIVTTRSERVSSIMGTLPVHRLNGLENEFCWSIFRKSAFLNDITLNAHPNLKEIGKKIVNKCKGVPLAVKSLGGLLHSKIEEGEWEYVLTSEIWELDKDGIMPALRLSYLHLPPHLKRCFAYCSIFPKDYLFKKEELVLLWMGEGFIHPMRNRQMEDIGREYFDELCFRSFFHQFHERSYFNEKLTFVMHDMIHDLAQFISKDVCFRIEEPHDENDDKLWNIPNLMKARHLSIFSESKYYKHEKLFDALYKVKSSRTFLLGGLSSVEKLEVSSGKSIVRIPHLLEKLDILFETWRFLRVLCLRNLSIKKLPDSIGNLKLLRFLDLSYTKIGRLPQSVCSLYHLQILLLEGLDYIKELPENISSSLDNQLVDIQIVKINTYRYRVAPGNGRKNGVEELKLRCRCIRAENIIISGLENVVVNVNKDDVNFKNYQDPQMLTLVWDNVFRGMGERSMAEKIIECIKPANMKLRELTIKGYYGERFPNWMAEMSNLWKLELDRCRCNFLPPLRKLRFLRISGMDICEGEWCSGGGIEIHQVKDKEVLFPCLQFFNISSCPKLKGLPFYRYPALKTLSIMNCKELTTIFTSPQISSSSAFAQGQQLPNLNRLSIYKCPKLRALAALTPFPSLESLEIAVCEELESLPEQMYNFTSLYYLKIYKCPRLMTFPNEGLPTNKLK
ncbi:PREDICTED: putative disease resistance protein At3g14460 [Nelumbo nucifera]|uniref:Disease resistance protein At3g14460 n=2 Tax=Nelumbo nucifera TaxID=4432 RepID=A0A1U8B2Z8_NELNU|nr:PREDICTED: putative disease resistance protein At3g14460 [Nelumbo nucifera]XP_010273640.1 PREDICTED: putative disease resistance protein At3g14460 [Nelumbo nucifera]XP_010273641.1 PREDICTED: putative disease resistance protein At3g14460 [Nelumbo nucifera]XP_010273642.1 PREDICTED: putative disease resistance protein At3g14460 [Nelumbo nucifera]DAD45294.1 TPA_asm: hypothetical protein HUJ06_003524 [Nelumbo nucifera]